MSIAAIIRDMAAAGASAEAIAIAVDAIERAQAAIDAPRAAARARKQRQRERERDMSRDSHATVTAEERDEPAPAPSPLPSPCTPNQPHAPTPTREDTPARTREPARSSKAPWPADMPPPAEVSDAQWAGYIAHRTKLRKPLTTRAYELLVAALAEHSNDEWPPGRIVDEMIQRTWLSFKPEWLHRKSDNRNGQRSHHDRPRSRGLLGAVFDAEHEGRLGQGF